MENDEPTGWRDLQERAQRETDPKKLAQIIDEMNRLLTEQERKAEGRKRRRGKGSCSAISGTNPG